MNWLPKIIRVEINRHYCDGLISPTCTCTPHYYWNGYKYYNWLWFDWKRKLIKGKHFEVWDGKLEFKSVIPIGVKYVITY